MKKYVEKERNGNHRRKWKKGKGKEKKELKKKSKRGKVIIKGKMGSSGWRGNYRGIFVHNRLFFRLLKAGDYFYNVKGILSLLIGYA